MKQHPLLGYYENRSTLDSEDTIASVQTPFMANQEKDKSEGSAPQEKL
jgi:hypothetical protein